MSASDFLENANRQLASTTALLQEQGKTLAPQVSANISNTVNTALDGIINDVQSQIDGALGALSSFNPSSVLSNLGSSLDNVVSSFTSSLPTSINFQVPGLNQLASKFSIGNLEFNIEDLVASVQTANDEINDLVVQVRGDQIIDQLGDVTTNQVFVDDFGETVVQTLAELKQLAASETIAPGTIVNVVETNSYQVVRANNTTTGDLSATTQSLPSTPTPESITGSVTPLNPVSEETLASYDRNIVSLHEYNRERQASGQEVVMPANGQQTTIIDGVPVTRPRSHPEPITRTTEQARQIAGISTRSPNNNLRTSFALEERESILTGEIQRLYTEMEAAVLTEKQRLVDSGEQPYDDDPRIEAIYTIYENRIATKEREREEVRSQIRESESVATESASGGSEVETTTTTTTTTSSTSEETVTGGGSTTVSRPVQTDAERLAEQERLRQTQETNALNETFSSQRQATGRIRRLNRAYPNRRYEAYENTQTGQWRIRKVS